MAEDASEKRLPGNKGQFGVNNATETFKPLDKPPAPEPPAAPAPSIPAAPRPAAGNTP